MLVLLNLAQLLQAQVSEFTYILTSPTGLTNGDASSWSTNNSGYIDNYYVSCIANTFVDKASGMGYTATGAIGTSGSTGMPLAVNTAAGSGCTLFALVTATSSWTPSTSEVFTVSICAEPLVYQQ